MKKSLNEKEIDSLICEMAGTGYDISNAEENWMFDQLRINGTRICFFDLDLDVDKVEDWTAEEIRLLIDELDEFQIAANDDQFLKEVGHDMGEDY